MVPARRGALRFSRERAPHDGESGGALAAREVARFVWRLDLFAEARSSESRYRTADATAVDVGAQWPSCGWTVYDGLPARVAEATVADPEGARRMAVSTDRHAVPDAVPEGPSL